MKKINLVVLYHLCRNIELVKDVGQIPFNLKKCYDIDSKIVAYRNSESYDFLNELDGLNVEFIENKGKFLFFQISPLQYLLKNYKTIDILNLYHFSLETICQGILFKLLNKSGIIYVKSDLSYLAFEKYLPISVPKSFFLKKLSSIYKFIFQEFLLRVFFNFCDIISAETSDGIQLLKRRYRRQMNKFILIPNGIYLSCILDTIEMKPIKQRENLILVTGRIGAEPKNHEMLIRAFALLDFKDWKAVLIGTIEDHFLQFYKQQCVLYSHLNYKITFISHIESRQELYSYYNNSKVFCMTSNREGFSLAQVEAIYFGNYIVTTDIHGSSDITKNGEVGAIVKRNDHIQLAKCLQEIINNPTIIEEKFPAILQHARDNYRWEKIVSALYNKFKSYNEEMS